MDQTQIQTYNRGFFDFKPSDYQLNFIHSCLNEKRVVAVFCRQSGKSEATSKVAIMFARVVLKPILIFAPTDRQAGLIAEKIRNTLRKFPYLTHFHLIRETQREFYFSNGGSIICETTGDKGESIRGYTAGVIIIEEAGSIKDSIIHSVILPMGATTGAPIIKIGTPRGMNHFYESYKDDKYVVYQITWREAVKAGILQLEYVEEMRRTMPSDKFRTEMEAEFIPDVDAYFSYNLIENCKTQIVEEESADGKNTYYLGADIARLGQDSTCLMVMKREGEDNKIVKIIDISKSTLDLIGDKIISLHQSFNFQKIFIDETGLGSGLKDFLARKYNPVVFKKTASFNDVVVGVRFTVQSKIDIYSNLKVLMEQGKIKYPDNRKLISQLRDFRYEVTASDNVKLHHSEYGFDDYCDALALAAQGCKVNSFVLDW